MKPLALLSIPLVLLTSGAQAQADPKKQLQAIYTELDGYLVKKQVDKAERLMTQYGHPDFVYIRADGRRQTYKECMAEMKASMGPATKMLKSRTRIVKAATKGSTVLVDTNGEWAMNMPGPDGKAHTFAGVTKTKDTWVKTPGGWKMKEVKTLSEKMTMDGKPFKM
ncbi:MAG: nuclear transport factor 2 family protein [Fimbriimonas sp.]